MNVIFGAPIITTSKSNFGIFASTSLFASAGQAGFGQLGIHGNSVNSPKPQHGYEIYNKINGEILEVGVIGQELNHNGSSPRAKQKIRTKYSNDPNVDSRVVINNVPGRDKILKWEKGKVGALKRNGFKLIRQIKP